MTARSPIPLSAVAIRLDSPEFGIVSSWPYADPFVARMLQTDIPKRLQFGDCQVWVYRDPEGQLVGFGVLDVDEYYKVYTSAKPHPYIVLLAVNPTIRSLGYGTTIVRHLIGEAAVLASDSSRCCGRLFLDVYVDNVKGINLYAACGFAVVEVEPIPDPLEGGKLYSVMSRLVTVEPTRVGQ